MGEGIAAAAAWLAANAGTVASVAAAGATVYSAATALNSGGDATPQIDNTVTVDKTTQEEAASLEAVKIGGDDKSSRSGAKAKFKVKRLEGSTGVTSPDAGTSGVQI